MSLLEDIFLQDEANEARELERVIEGDAYDEQRRSLSNSEDESDNEKRDDEAEEDKRRVDPSSTKTKRVIKNPRFILNPARLTGPRGIQIIPEHFKDFKFKGKGHEKEDLDMVLKKLEHWAYRLYPKFEFQDCLKKIETLGKKRPVMVHLHKIRTDQFLSEDTVVQKDSSDDETQQPQEEDEFDKLLQQQIELARATPAPGSVKKPIRNNNLERVVETPIRDDNKSPLTMPKATSSPSISEEQKERMLKNRKLAEQRRLARLKQATCINNTSNAIVEVDENKEQSNNIEILDNNVKDTLPTKINKSNVIDSSESEDECNVMTVNQSIVVDIHSNTNNKDTFLMNDDGKQSDNTVGVQSMNVDDDNIGIIQDNEESTNKRTDEVDDDDDKTNDGNKVIVENNSISLNNDDTDKKHISNVDNEDLNESPYDKDIIVEQSNEITDLANNHQDILQKETTEGSVPDVMDVDFSDDF